MEASMLRSAHDSRKPEPTIATIHPLRNSARQTGAYLRPVGFRGLLWVGWLVSQLFETAIVTVACR
jgi:hypothetical protein